MTRGYCRHLPVCGDSGLVGIIAIIGVSRPGGHDRRRRARDATRTLATLGLLQPQDGVSARCR